MLAIYPTSFKRNRLLTASSRIVTSYPHAVNSWRYICNEQVINLRAKHASCTSKVMPYRIFSTCNKLGWRKTQSRWHGHGKTRHASSSVRSQAFHSSRSLADSSSVTGSSTQVVTPPPTKRQLLMHALTAAIPMIGFGFMDNTIMIHAGHYVDCTLGVTFGLSTLAAAGIGQVFSGIGGVMFGDVLDSLFHRIMGDCKDTGTSRGGISSSRMTKAQQSLRVSRMVGLLGGIFGVTIGCTLALVNLLFVDEVKVSLLKLHALEAGQEFEFEVELDNEMHPGYTTIIVRGPDVDGVLASITASIASCGCSVAELHAGYRKVHADGAAAVEGDGADTIKKTGSSLHAIEPLTSLLNPAPIVEDIFLIRDRSTHQAIENENLEALGQKILAAAKDPLNSHSLKAQVEELQFENDALAERVLLLEKILESRQIKTVPSSREKS